MVILKNIKDWTPIQRQEPEKEVSLEVLLGVKTRLEEILITGIIRQSPHHVHIVDAAATALDSLNHHPFDVCILAHDLSDTTGCDMAKVIRRQAKSWHSIPIIGLLESPNQATVAKSLLCGMNTFLSTPITDKKILSLLAYYQMKKRDSLL